jgi:lysozyme
LETNPLTSEELKVCGDYKHGITKNAAFYLLRNDIHRVVEECKKKISFWSQLDNERQYALIDMVFQLGLGGVLKFRNMLKSMGVGNYKEAAEHCLDSKYAKQTPNRAKRIAKTIECGRFEI